MGPMERPSAVEALVRWLVLAAAGVGLLLVLPDDLFGGERVLVLAGRPATAANLVGLSLMLVAWLRFLVELFSWRGDCRTDPVCRGLFVVFVVTAVGSCAAAASQSLSLLVTLALPAVLAQVALAVRADRVHGAPRAARARHRAAQPEASLRRTPPRP